MRCKRPKKKDYNICLIVLLSFFVSLSVLGRPEVSGFSYPALTPFRVDEIDAKRFGTEEFLDTFSYRYPYRLEEEWEYTRLGYRGTAGSISSDEFWIDHHFRFAYDLTDRLHFHSHAYEAEDLDSRYRRFELGLDAEVLEDVRFGVYGEVIPEKGDNDLGVRLTFCDVLKQHVTVGFELPDVLMNTKGGDLNMRYSRQPRSVYLDVKGHVGSRIAWHWMLRQNCPLTLEHNDKALKFRYAQLSSYARVKFRATDGTTLLLYAGGQGADKEYRPQAGSAYDHQDFLRRSYEGRLEVRHRLTPAVTPYFGVRAFRVGEKTRYAEKPLWSDLEYRHREYLVYGGSRLALSPSLTFRPEVILGHVDRVLRDPDPENDYVNEHGFIGKAMAPFDFVFNDNARITAGVSFDIDEIKFGGGMVAFQMKL